VLVSVIIPTRDRAPDLARTLAALGRAGEGVRGEVVIADNGSRGGAAAPGTLPSGWPVRVIGLGENRGAAARNAAAEAANGDWLLMLDDDSAPAGPGWAACLADAASDAAAIGGEIRLEDGAREAGGLPEVFVGCGALVRRDAFLGVGGYDPGFGYYGEETDLCARLIGSGWRVTHDARLRVVHRRSGQGRDAGAIVERLARNECLTVHRYAPTKFREEWIERTAARRRAVAEREGVIGSFERGMAAFREAAAAETPSPLGEPEWDRLTGRAFARRWIAERIAASERVAVRMPAGAPGKHGFVIEDELDRAGALEPHAEQADVLIAGTLAPGLAIDAASRLRGERPGTRAEAMSALEGVRVGA